MIAFASIANGETLGTRRIKKIERSNGILSIFFNLLAPGATAFRPHRSGSYGLSPSSVDG